MDKADFFCYNPRKKHGSVVAMNQITYAGKRLLTYSVSRHAHSAWELIYCTSGEGRLVFDSAALAYQAGDLVIIPPLTPHLNESEGGFTNIHLNLKDPLLSFREPTLLREDKNHFLLDAFSAAFYLFGADPDKYRALLTSYGHLIVNLIQATLDEPDRSSVVEEIESAIIRNYPDENFELDRYLQSLPFNYDYLRKLFKREVGVTPHRLLSDSRLQAAAERLSGGDEHESITDISHLCGFREPLYFSRMFKKKYGVSPSEYQSRQQAPDSLNP